MDNVTKISVIVPTKNEATTPRIVRDIFKILGKNTEVIIIDKSKPEYRKMLYGIGGKLIIQKHGAYEHALVEGMRMAKGDILAAIDPDGTYTVKDLKRIIDYLASHGEYGYVGGNRLNCNKEAMPFWIRFGNMFLGLVASVLIGQRMEDTLSGSFAMRTSAYATIKNMDAYVAGPTIFQIALAKNRYRMRTIPISYYPRTGSKSKISSIKPLFGIKLALNMLVGRLVS